LGVFDPLYIPLSPTANFTSYYPNGFGLAEQEQLRNLCIELTKRGVFCMLSNSSAPLVRELYAHPLFFIEEVLVNRAINCRGDKRTKITELVITNYNPQKQLD
jgi:DNA adenine methylase